MGTIYHCVKKDERFTPTHYDLAHEADTEKEAIEWLSSHGGGIFRNILCGVEFEVKPNEKY